MKLTVLQIDLLPALQAVARSGGVRSTLPVLANVLLETKDGQLKLAATNLEVGVIKQVKAKIAVDGAITVPTRTLLEIVSSLPNSQLTLEIAGNLLKIITQNFSATLNSIPASEFPAIPVSSEQAVSIDGRLLTEAIPQITFAAAAEEGRPILTGILTEINKDQLMMVATDGFRLAHKTTTLKKGEESQFKALIPRRTFEEIVRLIEEDLSADSDQTVTIATSENHNQVVFSVGQTIVSSRLIEGQFPAWEKIIPAKFAARAVIDRQQFLKAVKLAAVFAKTDANIVKISVSSQGLLISSEAKELGGQQSQVAADTQGADLTIAFNSKFLLDALAACPSSQVMVEFSGSLSPALLKPIGEDGLEYVIMPIRLS